LIAVYALLGAVFGAVGGMGLGGGIVLIPALTLLLGLSQHQAQGMTLLAYVPMAAAALITHVRRQNVCLRDALPMMLLGCAGGAGGYLLASLVDAGSLRVVFALFLILLALTRIYRQEVRPRYIERKNKKRA